MNKNAILTDLAQLIDQNRAKIIARNQLDLANAKNIDATLYDRLKVDDKKVDGMVQAVREVIEMEDPQGQLLSSYTHPNGMLVENRVVPFGNVLIIYESRPDVTVEAAISAFKAGNKILLKGGKEARHSNLYLVKLWHEALEKNGADTSYVRYLDLSRTEMQALIKENTERADLIIPRGGEGLINFIRNNTAVPILVSGRGNNFVYVHEDADFDMASQIIQNGKSRLSVCNAVDKVLLHETMPNVAENITRLVQDLKAMNLEVFGTERIRTHAPDVQAIAGEDIFYEEFLSPKILLDLTESAPCAIKAINKYSGGHSAVIITADKAVARHFQEQVDCAAVYHNASSRFTDGGQFGFGAEIAISTQKLHFRGPVGMAQLVTNKWFIMGEGQVR